MTRILIFGDSLSTEGGPGYVLMRQLEERGHTVTRNAKVGRSAWNFYAREAHAQIIAGELAHGPEVVVVWLGTNELGLSAKTNLTAFARLRGDLGKNGARVIAVGPPAFADDERAALARTVYATMRQAFAHVLDARDLSADLVEAPYRAGDGVHFTARGAEVLGVRLADELVRPDTGAWLPALVAVLFAAALILLTRGGVTMS